MSPGTFATRLHKVALRESWYLGLRRGSIWLPNAPSRAASVHPAADGNSIRAYLAEYGIVAPVGRNGVERLLEVVADVEDTRLPEVARSCVAALGSQLLAVKAQILAFDRRIMAWHRFNEMSKRLDAIPGVGPALATALVASVADPRMFRSGSPIPASLAGRAGARPDHSISGLHRNCVCEVISMAPGSQPAQA